MTQENIIAIIKNKYDDEYKFQKALNEAEEIIVNYFNGLEEKLKEIIDVLGDRISIEYKQDNKIVDFRVENQGILFERCEKEIQVMKYTNCAEGEAQIKPAKITSIKPYDNYEGCKYEGNKFTEYDPNFLLEKAFPFLKEK